MKLIFIYFHWLLYTLATDICLIILYLTIIMMLMMNDNDDNINNNSKTHFNCIVILHKLGALLPLSISNSITIRMLILEIQFANARNS